MHSFLDAKLMAKALRQALAERGHGLAHADCLELVARQFGFAGWNMLAARIAAAGLEPLPLPEGWRIAGHTDEARYRLGLDPDRPGTARIESRPGHEDAIDLAAGETAVLMQSILADPFRGQALQLRAELSTEAADLATIWLRVDPASGPPLGFDNLLADGTSGGLSGTMGWTERGIVLDVPPEAATIHYGFFLKGRGRVWARNFRLDRTGLAQVPAKPRRPILPAPHNLDFTAPRH